MRLTRYSLAGAADPLLLEGVLDVLACVLRPLAGLPRGPTGPLSLPLHVKVWVAARAAGLCLGPALTHAEPVPQFVNQAHAVRLPDSGYQPGSSTPVGELCLPAREPLWGVEHAQDGRVG